MSDQKQVETALQRLFQDEGRIVFWNDPEREFQNMLPFLALDGVTKLNLAEVSALETKIRIERTETAAKFLLYSPTEEPDFEDDWLLDIRLYSRSFRADRASILLQELGLTRQDLRNHLAARRKFFDAKERLSAVKALVEASDVAVDLDRKMIAVVVRADQPELFNLVRTIFHAWTEAGLVTDFAHHLKGDVPLPLRGLLLPRVNWANVVVCLAQWRDSHSKGRSYDLMSGLVEGALRLAEHLRPYDIEALLEVPTFLAVEKYIASSLRERVQATADTIHAGDVRAVATRRQTGHWASATVADTPQVPRQALHAVYDALIAAADFFALRNLHRAGFDYPDAARMYKAYESELYLFDQLYRHFCEAADLAERASWNLLKSLRPAIENTYVHWYLTALVLSWGKFIEQPGGLLEKWQISDVQNQYKFYERNVAPWLAEGENKRAFVIISDAFRYEAAHELAAELNGKYRFSAQLSSQLGVLPSYTALGMASLLPHQTLAYKAGAADVLVNGRSSAAGERDGILQSVGGMACKAEELMAKKKDEGREFVKDKRVVYIYHDKVDAIGDDAKTEADTFKAVRQAIDELAALIVHIVNNLNGHHIVVTADHGFLFTETAPGEADKSKLGDQPKGTVLAKKRYLLGRQLPAHASAWHGKTAVTAKAEGEMEFWIPKGANRFHFVGGSRFVHGGAMPQEIVVPVLTVRHVRGKAAQETKTKQVTVQVLGSSHRITTTRHRFELIQMDVVSERVKAIKLKVAIYDGEKAISNVETVTFDSSSGNMDDRKKWINLALAEGTYNKRTPYRLVLRDADTGIEQQSVEVIIDRAFTDDF
jgi:uncharacterized protein (TIGR02687 family)